MMVFKKAKVLLLLLICFGVWGMTSPGWAKVDIHQQIEQAKKKLTQTKAKEKSVISQLGTTQKELDQIGVSLSKLNSQVGMTEQRINQIKAELNKAEAKLVDLDEELVNKREVLNQRLIAIYKYGYQSYVEALFGSQDFGEFITRFELIGNFVNKDLKLLNQLQQQLDQIARTKEEISQKQAELLREKKVYARLQTQTKSKRGEWLSKEKQQQRQLAALQNDRRQMERALDELEKTSKEMESQIQKYQNKNRNKLGSGQMIWPAKGRISSPFGYRMHPILKKRKYHSGIDIAVPMGTPILAADDGVIFFSGTNGGYGKMVTIDHGAGLSSIYAHCSALLVKAKDKVKKGQKIALVGSTGLSTGPHLHFEVRKEGKPDDPMRYL